MTIGQKNALESAKDYLAFTAFSYEGLIEQLEFEDYSHEDAVFAADNCGADWNEQAAKSAKDYLSFSSFSRQSLIEQLEFEGFTHAQAVYGVEANGY
ncbi:MAG: Ltp family lipoprotein [Clostridia bacterium]|nr:Ltp family lipoprotein [Clostridia bacterium]